MRRHLVVAAVVVAVVVLGAAVRGLLASRPREDLAAVFPPITPTATGSAGAGIVIPEGSSPTRTTPDGRWATSRRPGGSAPTSPDCRRC
ncbi:hypothetical protein ACFFMN_41130 [Planobispora siamensis]|uniref:Uncharacterized protein n=1 Tax=Planobispora siamensis TaxID=936338 RepID=A0A8J3SNG6_9ACTN|nr:hypothetical protein [Planobispora siamensis]GIH95811.1 hypothetical protein Psi01_64410 [Planobispora siamensis]